MSRQTNEIPEQAETQAAAQTTILHKTFTTGYRRDLEQARQLVRERRAKNGKTRVRVAT